MLFRFITILLLITLYAFKAQENKGVIKGNVFSEKENDAVEGAVIKITNIPFT